MLNGHQLNDVTVTHYSVRLVVPRVMGRFSRNLWITPCHKKEDIRHMAVTQSSL